jgi:hypothetical protein
MDTRRSKMASTDPATFDNMIHMDDLTDQTLLQNIEKRYNQNLIYVRKFVIYPNIEDIYWKYFGVSEPLSGTSWIHP